MDFGDLEEASLASLISSKQANLESPALKNIAVTHNNKLTVNEATLRELETEYPENLLAFYAVYGSKNAGKGLWCDRTYDLSDVGCGSNFYCQQDQKNGVYFLNVPFTKANLKIFLLDCTAF